MSVDGIDVSHWQTATPSLRGLAFLFARATFGTIHDDRYAQHIANARNAGLLVGAYAFGTGTTSGQTQAAAFLTAAGNVDFYVLDLERNAMGATMTTAQARAFIATVKAHGHRIGLYHSESGYPYLGQDFNWVANWTRVPAVHWTFWQYGGTGVDRDRFVGTLAALQTLAGKPQPAPTFSVHVTGKFGLYTVNNNVVTDSRVAETGGFTASCTGPKRYPWAGHTSQTLVRLLTGPKNVRGRYVRATWMRP